MMEADERPHQRGCHFTPCDGRIGTNKRIGDSALMRGPAEFGENRSFDVRHRGRSTAPLQNGTHDGCTRLDDCRFVAGAEYGAVENLDRPIDPAEWTYVDIFHAWGVADHRPSTDDIADRRRRSNIG